MKVLVSNDDGIYAQGLYTLVSVLKDMSQVTVVCPDRQRSGAGHSISVESPLKVSKVDLMAEVDAYQVNGTPADCIKVGLEVICPQKPDLIISGMNAGANVGQDVYYSGTIGAAREGALYGIPAIAFSLARDQQESLNFEDSVPLLRMILNYLIDFPLPKDYILNVNLPAVDEEELKGIKVVNPELSQKKFDFLHLNNPKGQPVYWLNNRYNRMEDVAGDSDYQLLRQAYITISPIPCFIDQSSLCQTIQEYITKKEQTQ